MQSGPALAEEQLDRYQPLGAFGQPIYRSHVQLQAALRGHLGEKYANFFAVPHFDPQGKTVRWIAPVAGEPVRWADLSEEEQVSRALDLQVMKSEFDRYLEVLRAQERENKDARAAKAFAAVLEQALRTPNDGHLFFLGDQPVTTFWGFREEHRPPFETLTVAPRVAILPAAAPSISTGRRGLWWWLLPLLLLGLLLAALLLWWWFRIGGYPNVDGVATSPRLERRAGDDQPDASTADPSAPPSRKPAVRETVLLKPDDGRAVVDEMGVPLDPGVVAGAGDDAAAVDVDPPSTLAPETPEPPAPETLIPETLEPPPVPAEPEPELGAPSIPPEVEDGAADFMVGEWRSDSGLVDAQTQQKLAQEYTFDDQGRGEVVIRRADGVVCRAPAEATMQSGALQVEELEHLECSDGSSFKRSRTLCTKSDSGEAECVGMDDDGSRFKVNLNRGGQP